MLKAGIRVCLLKPDNSNGIISWHPEMDRFDGQIQSVSQILSDSFATVIRTDEAGHHFIDPNWVQTIDSRSKIEVP